MWGKLISKFSVFTLPENVEICLHIDMLCLWSCIMQIIVMGTNNLNVAWYPGRSHVFNVTCTRTRFQCYTACNIENMGEA